MRSCHKFGFVMLALFGSLIIIAVVTNTLTGCSDNGSGKAENAFITDYTIHVVISGTDTTVVVDHLVAVTNTRAHDTLTEKDFNHISVFDAREFPDFRYLRRADGTLTGAVASIPYHGVRDLDYQIRVSRKTK